MYTNYFAILYLYCLFLVFYSLKKIALFIRKKKIKYLSVAQISKNILKIIYYLVSSN